MKRLLTNFICLAIYIILPFFTSCNDLDEVVYSSVTEENFTYESDDLGLAIGGIYNNIRTLGEYTANFSAQENSSDIIVMPANSTGWDNGGQYKRMHHHNWTSEQVQFPTMWNNLYGGVVICNTVIENLESGKITLTDEKKQEGILEARAVRAFYYWQICDNFGDAPLVTSSNSNTFPSKSSRNDIFSFIEQELTEIIPQLSEETGPDYYGRMNKWAAKALLANLYLNAEIYTGTAQWEKCIEQCNDIINSGKFELEGIYKDLFRSFGMENNKEIIFTIPYDHQYGGGNRLHCASWDSVLKDKFNLRDSPYGSGCIMGIPQFINTYNASDTRLQDTWLMGLQKKDDGTVITCVYDNVGSPLNYINRVPDGDYTSESEGYRMNKYEVAANSFAQSDTDIPVFRYAEVLMMKAECLLRSNKAGAGELVTQVRRRAFKQNPDLANVTDEQLKENSSYEYGYVENYEIVDEGDQTPIQYGRMYDELGWEFAWEMHRRRDAIRFGVYTTKSWLSHKPNGAYRSVFPIPQTVLTANPNLTQNQGYE